MANNITCDSIYAAFKAETGRINDNQLFRRNVRKRPIVDLMMEHRGAWEDGMGVVLNNLTMARNFPLRPVESRIAIAASNDSTIDSCLPPVVTLKDGQITQEYKLRHLALQTKDYCINDIRTATQFAKVLASRFKELAEIAAWTWANWFTYDFVGINQHKLTQRTDGVYDNGNGNVDINANATQPVGYNVGTPPNAALAMGTLEDISNLVYNEGELPFATDMDTGSPVNVLIIGEAASRQLLRDNPDLRNDIRYAWMGAKDDSPLLPGGRSRKVRHFGGWVHQIDPYPRRFDIEAGAYVERDALLEETATQGTNQKINPAYRYARYEEILPWNPSVYRSLVPNTMPVSVAGWNFDPVNHMGHFEALNIKDKTCNPRGEKMFFDAVFSDAAEPLYPNVGYSILALNCGFNKSGTACTPASSASGSGA